MAESSSQPELEVGSGRPESRSWYGSAPDDPEDELIGSILSGSYRVVRVLGEGAMGRVYEAEHTRLGGKRFAVKVLHQALMRYQQIHLRFQREAEAMSLLDDPHIIGVFDVDHTPDGRPYMVTELLEGEELGEFLDRMKKVPLKVAVHIARQLCRGLSAAHASGVTHRDMKPENVFLVGGDPPSAKVLDFGLARLEAAAGDSLTHAGTVMGTPSYMAPEQARGQRVDGRADVYAVGAIMYRMLTGRRPFECEDARATLAAVLTEEPPRPRSLDPTIGEDVEIVIQRAMAREPAERYQTADELDDALARLVADPAQVPAPRPRQASQLSNAVVHSRGALVMMVSLLFMWALATLTSGTASAAELLLPRGNGLSLAELGLLTATIIAVLATPAFVYVQHLKRSVWNNSLHVSREVTSLRTIAFASMAAYGAAALSVQLSKLLIVHLPVAAERATWSGWPLALLLVSAVAGAAAAMSRRLARQEITTRARRFVAGPVLASATLLLGIGIMYAGFTMPALPEVSAGIEPEPPVPVPPPEETVPPGESVAPPTTAPPVAPPEPPPHASATELTDALAGGAESLEALAKKYPEDAAVMKALVDLYAKDTSTHLMALEWAARALALQPDLASWNTLKLLLLKSAQADEPAMSRALEVIASEPMGSDGPDLLYDLMVAGKQSVRPSAETLLAQDEVRARATPALAIAYDLKVSDSCDAMLDLLERAAADGDERAAAVLSYSVDGAKRGCGRRRNMPCPARCGDRKYQDRFRATVAKIRNRLGKR